MSITISDFLTSDRIPHSHKLQYARLFSRVEGDVGAKAAKILEGRPVIAELSQTGETKEPVGTELAKIIAWIATIPQNDTCGCGKYSDVLDSWGADTCEKKKKEIVATLMKKRALLEQSLAAESWWKGAVVSAFPDFAIRYGAGLIVRRAIRNARAAFEKLKTEKAAAATVAKSDGRRLRPLPIDQDRLHAKSLLGPKPELDPFEGVPCIHFGAHLWPIRQHWEWHVDQWNRLAESITGRCFVGVSECNDCGTVSIQEVRHRLSSRFEVFAVPNTSEGENPTFRELLKRVDTGNDDVFLYAHGKGVKPLTRESVAVKRWTEIMYETVIFNHDEIIQRFSEGYRCFGSLRAFGPYPLTPKHSWHYAGTFFAVRAKYLPECSGVVPGYGGVEAWPGNNFPANFAWCEFGDNRRIHTHYLPSVMLGEKMNRDIERWRQTREARRVGNGR